MYGQAPQHSVLPECSCNAVRVLYITVCVVLYILVWLRLRKDLGFKFIYKNIIYYFISGKLLAFIERLFCLIYYRNQIWH